MKVILTFLRVVTTLIWNFLVGITQLRKRHQEWKENRRNPRESTPRENKNRVANLVESDISPQFMDQKEALVFDLSGKGENDSTSSNKSSPPSLENSQKESPDLSRDPGSPERIRYEEMIITKKLM